MLVLFERCKNKENHKYYIEETCSNDQVNKFEFSFSHKVKIWLDGSGFFLIESKSGDNPKNKGIEYDSYHNETEPGKSFKIIFQDIISQIPETFQINFLTE